MSNTVGMKKTKADKSTWPIQDTSHITY
jgi:hypothetical protein